MSVLLSNIKNYGTEVKIHGETVEKSGSADSDVHNNGIDTIQSAQKITCKQK